MLLKQIFVYVMWQFNHWDTHMKVVFRKSCDEWMFQ